MGFDFRMPKQTPEQKEASQELRMKGLKEELAKVKEAFQITIKYERSPIYLSYEYDELRIRKGQKKKDGFKR